MYMAQRRFVLTEHANSFLKFYSQSSPMALHAVITLPTTPVQPLLSSVHGRRGIKYPAEAQREIWEAQYPDLFWHFCKVFKRVTLTNTVKGLKDICIM